MASKLDRGHSFNRQLAIQELNRSYELVTRLQPRLELLGRGNDRCKLARDLSDGVLQALSVALSMVNSNNIAPAKPQARLEDKRSADGDYDQRDHKRRREMDSWKTVTPAPYDDGYQWRKYGQKRIHNAKHPRSYYRCTYSDQGCLATKQVQQEDRDDFPMFLVTYNKQHTCTTATAIPTPHVTFASSSMESSFVIFEANKSNPRFAKATKHERLLPPLVTPKEESLQETVELKSSSFSPSVLDSTSLDLTWSTGSAGTMEGVSETVSNMGGCINLSPFCNPNAFEFELDDIESILNYLA